MSYEVVMPWGKHQGWRLVDLPSSYLAWVAEESGANPWLKNACRKELSRRYSEVEVVYVRVPSAPSAKPAGNSPAVADTLTVWFRRLCLAHHPDRGGSNERMRVVNEANDTLRTLLRERGVLAG